SGHIKYFVGVTHIGKSVCAHPILIFTPITYPKNNIIKRRIKILNFSILLNYTKNFLLVKLILLIKLKILL
ncbi:MAG: hypothetical protein QXD43_04520, partial [Candidatus Aenigmatarchaeota archaeon]